VLEFRNKRIHLQEGDLFCLHPNITYTYYRPADQEADKPLHLFWLAIDGSGAEQIVKLAGFEADNPIIRNRWDRQMDDLLLAIHEILRWNHPKKISDTLELTSLLYKLFASLIHSGGEPETTEPMGWVKACADYIDLHACEGITVQHLARMVGYNRTYFSTVFAQAFGVAPAEYIYKVRMSRAKELLLGTSASITEIANSLGYPSLFTFTRAFKKYFTLSPSEYRSRNLAAK